VGNFPRPFPASPWVGREDGPGGSLFEKERGRGEGDRKNQPTFWLQSAEEGEKGKIEPTKGGGPQAQLSKNLSAIADAVERKERKKGEKKIIHSGITPNKTKRGGKRKERGGPARRPRHLA